MGPPTVVDVANGRIRRICPLHYDRVEKVTKGQMDAWRLDHPQAFVRNYDLATGVVVGLDGVVNRPES